nr:MAG TPA: hypothetical protein [Caudoviricetes sp.]
MTYRAKAISQKKCSTIPILLSLVQVTTKKEQRQRRARNNRSYEEVFIIRQIPASILYIKGIDAGIFYYIHISILTNLY